MSLSLKTLAVLALALSCVAAMWLYGQRQWQGGYAEAKAQGDKTLAEWRLEQARQETARVQAALAAADAAVQAMQKQQTRANQLAGELAEQQRQYRQTTDRLTGEIARVNDLYRDALDAPPKPLPACVFTAGWVRVYDQATGALVPAASDPQRTAAPATQTAAAEQLDSGISQGQLLAHHIRYAEQCRNTTRQLELLIDQVSAAP